MCCAVCCCSPKHLFVGFYFDEFVDQSRDSSVKAGLLIKVMLKEFAHMNGRDELLHSNYSGTKSFCGRI